ERRRQQAARQPIGVVLPQAQAVVDALGGVGGVEAVSVAGSLRRMRDTIADIDIVVATRSPRAVMDVVAGLPEIGRVLGRGPTLTGLGEIRGDLHMHTTWGDGDDTAEAMARAAKARGYEYIAITDHSRSLKFAGGVSVEDLRAHADAVRALADRVGIRVLIGSEVDILPDGSLDYPDEVLRTLDLVIGSVHSRFRMSQDEMTRRVITAMQNPHLDVL